MARPAIGILGQALIPLALGTGIATTVATLVGWWRDIDQERALAVQRLAQQAELRTWMVQPHFDHVVENLTRTADLLHRRLTTGPAGELPAEADGTRRRATAHQAAFVAARAATDPHQVTAAGAAWSLLLEYGPGLAGQDPQLMIAVDSRWLVGWGSDAIALVDAMLPDDPVLLPAETATLAQPGSVRWSPTYLEPATGSHRIAAVTSLTETGLGQVAITQVLPVDTVVQSATAGQRSDGTTVVFDARGRILGSTRPQHGQHLTDHDDPLHRFLATQVPAQGQKFELLTLDDGQGWVGISRIRGPDWVMATYHPATAIMREARAAAWQSLLIGLGLLAAQTVLLVVVLRWRVSRPLWRLAAAANDLASGTRDLHLDDARQDEIGLLSRSFNQMSAAIAQREEALREREQMARALVASAADAVLLLVDGRISEANPRACALFAIGPDGLVGRAIADLAPAQQPDGTDSIAAIAGLMARAAHEAVHFPWRHRRPDGREFDAEIGLAGIELPGPQRLVAVVRDVTRRNQLEERLRQSQKMESLGQLAGGIAHDFNNALAGILGSAELLQDAQDPTRRKRLTEQIITSSERAAGLTRKMLSFARKGRVAREAIDVHRILLDTIGMLESSLDKRIRIHHDLSAATATIVGDAALVQHALLNLAVNARDAMPDGGELRFATTLRQLDAEAAARQAIPVVAGTYLEITVTDTGSGIPPTILERIFEPFFTTKPVGKGTGLGLAAVWGTMQDHHGSIAVTSQTGHGTTFSLLLPLANATAAIAVAPATRPGTTGTALIVDDEEAIRANVRELLLGLGWQVMEARDGQEALDLFTREHHRIDLVLLDLELPKLRGPDCLQAMRAVAPAVRALLISGHAGAVSDEQWQAVGFRGVVGKPFRAVELLRALDSALAQG